MICKTNFKKEKVLIIIIISIISLSGYSIGKGITNISLNNNMEISKPICIVEGDRKIDITTMKNTGKYNFIIKNHNEQGEITNTNLVYYIEILLINNDKISFKLYKNDEEISIENNKTESMILTKDEIQEDRYILETTYLSEYNEERIQDIQLKIHSEQLND